jgi:hypothetical protein
VSGAWWVYALIGAAIFALLLVADHRVVTGHRVRARRWPDLPEGDRMKIELTCTSDQLPQALDLLDAAFEVDSPNIRSEALGQRESVCLYAQFRPVEVTPVIACHVLHHFGEGGYAPGSFVRDLILVIARADPQNRRLLALGHPAYVLAVGMAQAPGGMDELREIAESGRTAVIS